MWGVGVLLAATVLGLAKGVTAHPKDLRLINNGYEGLVVSISDTVSEEHCNHVIHGLKVRRLPSHY